MFYLEVVNFMKKIIVFLLLSICFYGFIVNASTLQEKKYKEVMIEENETLWDVAKRNVGTDKDIRKYIYEIQKINKIEDPGKIIPGKIIKLPE